MADALFFAACGYGAVMVAFFVLALKFGGGGLVAPPLKPPKFPEPPHG